MILIDTSVWIDFFRGDQRTASLSHLLVQGEAAIHPWVLGELRLGHLGATFKRRQVLSDLGHLPASEIYPLEEISDFVEKEKLYGKGLALVDIQLLYTVIVEGAQLWSHDKGLHSAASHYGRNHKG